MKSSKDLPIKGNYTGKDILSLDQFEAASVLKLFRVVEKIKKMRKKGKNLNYLSGIVAMLLFYEPSSRTFGSFSSAIKRLGGQTISYQNPFQTSSAVKGESLEDSTRTFEHQSDVIIVRHPEIGSAIRVADTATIPVINAGDGGGEHPTQTLLDLYTIYEHFGRLDNLSFVMSGDPYHSRTIKSLIAGLGLFKKNTVYILSPKALRLSTEDKKKYRENGTLIYEIESFNDMPKKSDVWYWNRIQKERFKSPKEYKKVIGKFVLTPKILREKGSKNLIILDPLPRIEEIELDVDKDPRALYLSKQMENGVYTRMALLSLIFNRL